ncbi:MAG: hypothetical protein AAFP98_10345, partial [Pseudomonadota bacterium]
DGVFDVTAFLDTEQEPYPIVPNTESDLSDVADTAEGVLERINDLPIEELMQGAIDLMASIETLATDGDLRDAPEELLGMLTDVRTLIASDGIQSAPDSVQTTLAGVEDVVGQLSAILTQAREADLIGGVSTTISSANETVTTINTSAAALPAVIAQIEALATKANALELEALVAQTNDTLARIDALVASDSVAALPENLNAALNEVRTIVATAGAEGGSIAALNAALAAAEDAAAAVGASVAEVPALTEQANALLAQLQAATANLPAITANVEGFVTSLNQAEVDALIAQADATLARLDALLASDGAKALPATTNAAMEQIRTLVAELRSGGAIENLNAALVSASAAAQSVATSVESLPALSEQANALLVQLQTAAEDLPKITAQVETLLATANAVEIDSLVAQAEATLTNINALVASESTRALPGNLNDALNELETVLTEIRAGGAVANVNGMLASASAAAAAVEAAAADLPALSREASQLVNTINSVAAVYSERGRFTADTAATLRDIQEAADAVSALARAIQRNPSSILTGR